jgi:hypothetical protein
LNHGAPQARKIDCHRQSAAKTDEGERAEQLFVRRRSILMSDTKDASRTSKGKIASSRLGSSSFPCRAGGPFFLVVSEIIAASCRFFPSGRASVVRGQLSVVASSAG